MPKYYVLISETFAPMYKLDYFLQNYETGKLQMYKINYFAFLRWILLSDYIATLEYSTEGPKRLLSVKSTKDWIASLSLDDQLILVRFKPTFIMYIKEHTAEMQRIAMDYTHLMFDMINDPNEETCIRVLQKQPQKIKDIQNQTEAMHMIAVERGLFKLCKNPSEKIQLMAVKKNPYNIKYINDPSEALLLTALALEPNLARHLKK